MPWAAYPSSVQAARLGDTMGITVILQTTACCRAAPVFVGNLCVCLGGEHFAVEEGEISNKE